MGLHKKAFVVGLFMLFTSLILIEAITSSGVTGTPLLVVTVVLLVVGIPLVGYSIWEDVH